MLIAIEQIYRRGADSEPTVLTIGINPDILEEAVPHEDAAVEGPCVKLSTHDDGVIYCRGTVEAIIRQTHEAVWGPPRPEPDAGV